MSRSPDDRPPPSPTALDYSSPGRERTTDDRKRFGYGLALGAAGGCGALAALVFGSAWVAAALNPDGDYASLGGALIGGIAGPVLLLVAAAVLIPLGNHRNSPVLRGAGFGALLTLGLTALGVGICAVAIR